MNVATDLFESIPLLSWLPDETLFSLVSRHHYFWSHSSTRYTNLLFFGQPQGGSQHDFPNCIEDFSIRTAQRLGGTREIGIERTLLRYYRAFMNATKEEEMLATLCSRSVSNLKFRLGILTSRFRANHPLKACTSCMEKDRTKYGWPYWHMQHQYPGVWICPIHQLPLHESNLKANGVERFHWHVQNTTELRPWRQRSAALPRDSLETLNLLANFVVELVDHRPVIRIDPTQLPRLYRAQLAQRNFLTRNGRLRLTKIAAEFAAYVQRLRILPEFEALPFTVQEAYSQMSRLLRMPRTGTHPLRHFVLMHWLFGDSKSFLDEYEQLMPPLPEGIRSRSHRSASLQTVLGHEERQLQLAKLIQTDGKSVTAAAATLGIDVATAMVWAAQQGIATPRRPKKLHAERRQALIENLRQGMDKREAAAAFDIAVTSVTQVLRSEVGLHKQWQQVRHQTALISARECWSSLVSQHEKLGVKFIRNLNPRVYAWLYRNDRSWLTEHSAKRAVNSFPSNPRVRWDERDLILSAAVERAALSLADPAGKQKLKLWHLYQEIPELKAKLSALDRLPLTLRAIEVALARPVPRNKLQTILKIS
jgi:transposase